VNKKAGSMLGYKHNAYSRELIRVANLGRSHSIATKLKMSANKKAHSIKVTNISTGNIKFFLSIRSTAKFMAMHHSYLAKCLRKDKFYLGKGHKIVLNV
jgi:hypothetical protein